MSSTGILARMHAKSGKEREVEQLLLGALPKVQQELDTIAWFALRFGRGEYGVFDVFPNAAAREAHLTGAVADELQRRNDLFESPLRIQKLDVLAEKVPIVSTEPDTKGLLLTFRAKHGHEEDVEIFLRDAKRYVSAEQATTAWFALRFEDGLYGIFDVFPGNEDRFLHLVGHVPRELAKQAFTLLGSMPDLELLNVQAEKIGTESIEFARQ